MIQRYSRPAMREIWSEQRKLEIWLEIELLASEALCAEGLVPKRDFARMRARAAFNLDRCKELERTLNHDVIAFTTAVSEYLGPESRWLHYGLTSNDVVDTAQNLLLKEASAIILDDLRRLSDVLKRRALEFQHRLLIARALQRDDRRRVHARPHVHVVAVVA